MIGLENVVAETDERGNLVLRVQFLDAEPAAEVQFPRQREVGVVLGRRARQKTVADMLRQLAEAVQEL